MRRLLNILKAATIERLATATTPTERLIALVEANFDDRLFTPEQCSLWVQFWSNAPYSDMLARLHRINRVRVHSHLQAEVKKLVTPKAVNTVTATIQAYMDGVWLEAAQSGHCNASKAQLESTHVLERLLA